ncbi:MAG: hypothetical protein WCD43_16815 [Candidatus Acidiferrales bacterium]
MRPLVILRAQSVSVTKMHHYRKVSANVVQQEGQQVKWQTVYDMLDETGCYCHDRNA